MTSGDNPSAWARPSGAEQPDPDVPTPPPMAHPLTAPPASYGQTPHAPLAPYNPYSRPPPYGPPTSYGQTPYGQAQSGQAQSGQAHYGQAQFGQAQYGQAQYGQAQFGQAQYGPYGPYPWGPVPVRPQAAPGRVRWLRWLAGALAVLFVCGVGGVGGIAGVATHSGVFDRRATWNAGAPEVKRPAQNAPASQWREWVRDVADDAVKAQARGLLAGDEGAFLAAVDPGNATLVAEHKRRFKVLRALTPGVFTATVGGAPSDLGSRSWRVDLRISYCFGPLPCPAVQLQVTSKWALKNNKLLMVDLEDSDEDWTGPRPWEVDDLAVVTGTRAIVAATKVNSWRLPDAIKAADAAATVADKFAKWHDPPSRYVIFLAGPSDWKKWYGHDQPGWAAAWAVPVGNFATEVVIRTEVVRQSGLQGLLTHELTHVTTLAGDRDGAGGRAWWLIEGIAEYAQFLGRPVRQYDGFAPLRSFVRGSWNGDVMVSSPGSSASLDEAAGRYGVAYLAVRRIAEKYGQAKMLDFWGRVVHDGDSVEEASRSALGAPWATVKADCARYVRSAMA